MMCLAFNIYHEARGTSATEQAKVINVIVNRSNKRKVNYCTTTFEKGQFSWTSSFKPKYEFKDYDSILVLTQGGPDNRTQVMFLYIYQLIFGKAVAQPQIGYATVLSITGALIIGIVTAVYLFFARKLDEVV